MGGAVVAVLSVAFGSGGPITDVVTVALGALILGSFWALRYTNGLVGRLADAAAELADGRPGEDVARFVAAAPGTGFAAAAEALDAIACRIERLLEAHDRLVRDGGPELERLAATTQQLSAAGQEVAATVQALSDDAGVKAAAVQRAAEAGEMIAAATREVVLGVTEAVQLNAVTHELAEAQQAAILESALSVQSFIEDVRATVAGLQDLAAAAERTASFVDTIRSINRQTNILALNAAIEAARAGNSGRGFAVVADEVRKLAERALAAAKEVAELIGSMRDHTENAVQLARENARRTDDGTKLITDAGAKMGRVLESVHRVGSLVQRVSSAVSEQSRSSQDLRREVEHIRELSALLAESASGQATGARSAIEAVERISERTRQVADATVQVRAGGEQVLKAIENISVVARQNQDAVHRVAETMGSITEKVSELTAHVENLRLPEKLK